jgi:hypothetical protein
MDSLVAKKHRRMAHDFALSGSINHSACGTVTLLVRSRREFCIPPLFGGGEVVSTFKQPFDFLVETNAIAVNQFLIRYVHNFVNFYQYRK